MALNKSLRHGIEIPWRDPHGQIRAQELPPFALDPKDASSLTTSTRLAPIVTVPFPLLDQMSSDSSSQRYAKTSAHYKDCLIGGAEEHGTDIVRVEGQQRLSVKRCLQSNVPLGASVSPELILQFVNSHGPPAKRGAAIGARIRAHAMRRVHQQRRIAKTQTNVLGYARGHPKSTGACLCSQLNADELRNQDSQPPPPVPCNAHPSHELKSSGYIIRIPERDTPVAGVHEYSIAAINASATCKQCGNLKLLSSPTDRNQAPAPSPRLQLSHALVDPFANASVYIDHRMHELLNHYILVQSPSMEPFIYGKNNIHTPTTLNLVPMAMANEATMHALITMAGYHRLLLRDKRANLADYKDKDDMRQGGKNASYHLFEAFRLLQNYFKDPKYALSDASIRTAMVLTACTGFTGDPKQLSAHHDGLVKMVELRGGINCVPRDLAQSLSRIESYGAWTSASKPRLPMYKSRFRERNTSGPILFPDRFSSPFDNDRFEKFLWKTLFQVACDLQFLTHILELHQREASKIGAMEREYFEDTYAAVQHRLVSLPHPADILSTSIVYYRQNCWRMAALLYLNIGIRRSPTPNLLKSMTSRLIKSFQESDMSQVWAPFSDILLWVLCMGCCGSWDETEKGWFVLELRRVIRMLDLHSLDELESCLRAFLYRSSVLQEPLRKLWKDNLT